jgi:hypothetical protein
MMNWAWVTSLDQIWRSPTLPMWVTLAAAVFFAFVLLITLLRAERSVANGALTVITLLAIGIAVAATMRNFSGSSAAPADVRLPPRVASLPALSCLDGLAGDVVEAACERALFSSADSSAAAVSYTAAQMARLASFGDEAAASKTVTPELATLRRAVERDRYGLVGYLLSERDACTPANCAFYKFLSDHNQIAANITEKTYQSLIGRYALTWNNPNTAGPATVGALPPSVPTGKPLSGDFPSSASIPPISIMTPEPAAAAAAAPKPSASPAGPPPARTAAAPPATPPAPKKPPPKPAAPKQASPTQAQKNAVAPAPVPLAPPPQSDDN